MLPSLAMPADPEGLGEGILDEPIVITHEGFIGVMLPPYNRHCQRNERTRTRSDSRKCQTAASDSPMPGLSQSKNDWIREQSLRK